MAKAEVPTLCPKLKRAEKSLEAEVRGLFPKSLSARR
nr:MAG TPA: hypothetical protein [Caudoviricetes sp.]